MGAVLFIREWNRMCKSCGMKCSVCDLGEVRSFAQTCRFEIEKELEKSVEIVEKWSRENPLKTMMDDFFEKFPNAPKDEQGFPSEVCPYMLGYDYDCPYNPSDDECAKCWSRPLEVTK